MDVSVGYLMDAFRWVLIFVLALIWPQSYEPWQGKVVEVVRPDEIQVQAYGKTVNVRLYGIDSPLNHQAFSKQAKAYTTEKVMGKVVGIQPLPGKVSGPWYKPKIKLVDKSWGYNRIVGWVYIDGECLNTDLLKKGMAWWNKPHVPFELGLKHLQDEARKAKRGLWADSHPVPPWEFQRSPIFKVNPMQKRTNRVVGSPVH